MTYVQIAKIDSEIISLKEVKNYLKIKDSVEDPLIQELIKSTIVIAEKKMNRDILTTTYENYRSSFYQDLTLRRAGYQSVEKIEYLFDGSYQLLDAANYKVTIGGVFGVICKITSPPNTDDNCKAVKITFKTGFGDTKSDVPENLKIALKSHIAFMYSNRGDCSNVKMSIPALTADIYNSYRVIDIAGEAKLDCL